LNVKENTPYNEDFDEADTGLPLTPLGKLPSTVMLEGRSGIYDSPTVKRTDDDQDFDNVT